MNFLRIDLLTPNYLQTKRILSSIFSRSTLRFRCMNEKKNDGYTKKIREDGFNDIVDIIWEGGDRMMNAKSSVEKL